MILILLQRPSTWLHVSSANTDLYADITTLTCSIKLMDMHRLQTSLNAAVSETVHWATANKLPLNEKKTKVLTICGKRLSNRSPNDIVISVNGSQLENIQCAKLLGLEIDKELTFHLHVDKLYKKLSQCIGILKKNRHCLQIKHMVIFYNAIIRPVMDYVSVIWSNCDKHCLEATKRAARIVAGADSYAPSVLFSYLTCLHGYLSLRMPNYSRAVSFTSVSKVVCLVILLTY